MNLRILNYKILVISLIIFSVLIAGCVSTRDYSMEPDNFVSDISSSGIAEKSLSPQDESRDGGKTIPERKVISTAALTIEVESVSSALVKITNITLENEGFISSSTISDIGGNRKRGYLTARVPQKNFYPAIEKISGLGTEKHRQISGQDVTEEFIDLGARLDNLKKQEIRLQEILKMANTVKDILEIEHELERVRGEIDSLTGRLNFLNQSVEMSTISISIIEPTPITGEEWGISDALRDAVSGFIESIRGIIIFTGIIIPILTYLAIAILIALGIKRRIIPKLKG